MNETAEEQRERGEKLKASQHELQRHFADHIIATDPQGRMVPTNCWAFLGKLFKKMTDPLKEIQYSEEEKMQRRQFNNWYDAVREDVASLYQVLSHFAESRPLDAEDDERVEHMLRIARSLCSYYEDRVNSGEIEWMPKMYKKIGSPQSFATLTCVQGLRNLVQQIAPDIEPF